MPWSLCALLRFPEYTPYGEEWAAADQGSSEADANPIRFSGQYLDQDSGLYYMRAREYDPESGRFLEVDPREAEAGESDLSSYLYAEDDPTLLTDPSGLDPRFEGKTLNCKKNKDLCGLIYRSGYKDNCNSYRLRKSLSNLYNDVGVEVTQIFLVATGKGRIFYNKLGSKGPGFYFARWGRGVTKIGHPRGETCGWRCSVGFFATQVLGCGSTVGCDVQGALFFVPGPSKGTALMKSSPWLRRALNLERVGVRAEKGAKGGAEVVRIGQEGEAAVRAVEYIGPKTPIKIAGRTRIPDGLTGKVLTEVKNVKSLSFTRQLRDFASYAGSQKPPLKFELWVRSSTRLSGPLVEAKQAGRIAVRIIPGT